MGCIVFGNRFTQKLAYEEVGRAGGRVNEALIKSILEKAGERTASVSREHTVLRSDVKKCRSQGGSPEGSGGGLQRERLEAMRSAVILAGGNSRRLGAEKSLLEFEGKPLICWTAEKLSRAADEIVVVAQE